MVVVKNQFDCWPYSVQSSSADVLFEVSNYQGNADLFLSALSPPTSVASSSVKLYGKKQAPKHNLIARSADRAYWTASTGNLYVCGLAYSGLSAAVTVTESSNINYSTDNNVLNTFWLYQTPDQINFKFSNSVLSSQSLPLTLSL